MSSGAHSLTGAKLMLSEFLDDLSKYQASTSPTTKRNPPVQSILYVILSRSQGHGLCQLLSAVIIPQ